MDWSLCCSSREGQGRFVLERHIITSKQHHVYHAITCAALIGSLHDDAIVSSCPKWRSRVLQRLLKIFRSRLCQNGVSATGSLLARTKNWAQTLACKNWPLCYLHLVAACILLLMAVVLDDPLQLVLVYIII